MSKCKDLFTFLLAAVTFAACTKSNEKMSKCENKKVVVISTSLRPGSNSHLLAEQFAEGGGVNDPKEISGNSKLQEAYDLGKNI